jgi:hypothetical protein
MSPKPFRGMLDARVVSFSVAIPASVWLKLATDRAELIVMVFNVAETVIVYGIC